nr:hypothetical protein [uncultured Psychroserpens sp.]
MKKLILLSVACFLFAGSQLSFAQTDAVLETTSAKTRVQTYPKKMTNQIVNMLERTNKLEAEQVKKVYSIFSSVERKVKGVEAIEDSTLKNEKRAKLQDYINGKLKNVLNAQQFEIYLKNTVAK